MKHPVAILDDMYYRPVELVEVYISNIGDKKQTARLIQQLHKDLPLPNLQHLKRVRSNHSKDAALQVVVCDGDSDLEKVMEVLKAEECYSVLGKPYKARVPKDPPLTRDQFEESKLYWPLNFHEDKRVTKFLKGEMFSDKEILEIHSNMEKAIEIAISFKLKQPYIGAVIVDPSSNKVVARSYDCRHGDHPLYHAVMLCVDLVARSQGGGMWPVEDRMFYAKDITMLSPERKVDKLSVKHPATQSCRLTTESPSSSQQASIHVQESSTEMTEPYLCTGLVQESGTQKTGPYLCTGYDLCAMALVHSRIGRVFYGSSDPVEGALGSKYKLHTKSNLNHHYEVFSQVLQKECDNLWQGNVTSGDTDGV